MKTEEKIKIRIENKEKLIKIKERTCYDLTLALKRTMLKDDMDIEMLSIEVKHYGVEISKLHEEIYELKQKANELNGLL